jgi:hypothetical protein
MEQITWIFEILKAECRKYVFAALAATARRFPKSPARS